VEELCTLEKVLCSMEEPTEIQIIPNGETPAIQPEQHPQQKSVMEFGLAGFCAAVPDHYFQNFFASHPECRALLAPNRPVAANPAAMAVLKPIDVGVAEKSSIPATIQPPTTSTTTNETRANHRRKDTSLESSDSEQEMYLDEEEDEDKSETSSISASESGGDTASSSVSSDSSSDGNMVTRIKESLDGVMEAESPRHSSVVDLVPTISCSCAPQGSGSDSPTVIDSSRDSRSERRYRKRNHHQRDTGDR
jgi:hypothetical protein